jgi:Glycosyl hydrolases family 16
MFNLPPHIPHLSSLVAGALLTSGALVATVLTPVAEPPVSPAEPPELVACAGYCVHPTNAAKVYRWGLESWEDEFEVGSLNRTRWQSNPPGAIDQFYGMLSLMAEDNEQSITAWATDQSARYGRWEARVRVNERPRSQGKHYRVTWMLDPVGDDHCRASELTLATYRVGDARARGWVRSRDTNQFKFSRARNLGNMAWHTYAVEVTRKRISWFVDTKVVRTERRTAALSGVRFRPQFKMTGVPGAQMRATWMQMDWVRYYTLDRKNARSVRAKQMSRGTYSRGC